MDEKQTTAMTTDIRALIADDGYAASFQSMGQYRTALLAALRAQDDAAPVAWITKEQLEQIEEWTADAWVYWRESGHVAEPDEFPLFLHPSLPAAQGLSELQDEIAQAMQPWVGPQGGIYAVHSCALDVAKFILSRSGASAATVAEPSKIEPMRYDALEKAASEARAHIESECEKIGVGKAAQQQAEPESVIKRQAQKIGELIADRDSWIEAHARLYRLYHDQSPRAGEEIHVNVEGGDVYTLPLQLSGMDKPRFVVHVPCSPQAEPGADERIKRDAARFADAFAEGWVPLLPEDTNRTVELLRALAAQSGQRAGVAEDVIEAAAKKLAEDFDYPWEHMPAQGKDDFRAKVRSIAAMLAAPTQQQEGQ
uniref:Uncharacterized protein n=1 Tax=Ralstonia pickettii (strain 12D) TaxID=428406 RepID=C6BC87_RALP1